MTNEAKPPLFTGRCACGSVTYHVKARPKVVAQCHCDECRRLSGTGHAVGALFPASAVTVQGETRAYYYTGTQGSRVQKHFCPNCGSPMYGQNDRLADHMTIPLGSMDDPGDLTVEVVVFTDRKQHWDATDSDVLSFPTMPAWQPDDQT